MTAYEKDFHQWSIEQACFLKKRDFERLDISHLIEEIETLSASEERAMRSFLKVLFVHMLKIQYQSNKKTRSWDNSIKNSIEEVNWILKKNPSFKKTLNEATNSSYKKAVRDASIETGLDEKMFPVECPWIIEEILEK